METKQPQAPRHDDAFIPNEHANYRERAAVRAEVGQHVYRQRRARRHRGHDDGLFVNDTRVLSELRLTFGGRAPSLLSGSVSAATTPSFTAHLTNRPLPPSAATARRKA